MTDQSASPHDKPRAPETPVGDGRRALDDRAGSPVGRLSGVPLYAQIKQALAQRVRSGELRPGDLLPSESELCRTYGVSTITMRRALAELTREGLIRRQVGIGTFVSAEQRRVRIAVVYLGFEGVSWRRRSENYGALLGGIGDAAWHASAEFSFIRSRPGESSTAFLQGLIEESRFDGVLIRTAWDITEDDLAVLESRRIPYVAVKRHIPGRAMSFVTLDDAEGAFLATEHVIRLGHRRIGLLMGGHDILPRREQFRGYEKAHQQYGVHLDPRLVFTTPAMPSDEIQGVAAIDAMLGVHPRPTALFMASSILATGATAALHDRGLSIPDDMALVAYGFAPSLSAIEPALTAIELPYDRIGRMSAEILFELIARPGSAPRQVFLDAPLVIRDSCGARARQPRSMRGDGVPWGRPIDAPPADGQRVEELGA